MWSWLDWLREESSLQQSNTSKRHLHAQHTSLQRHRKELGETDGQQRKGSERNWYPERFTSGGWHGTWVQRVVNYCISSWKSFDEPTEPTTSIIMCASLHVFNLLPMALCPTCQLGRNWQWPSKFNIWNVNFREIRSPISIGNNNNNDDDASILSQ